MGAHQSNGGDFRRNGDVGEDLKRDMMELFSKLNPMAEELGPHSLAIHGFNDGFYVNSPVVHNNGGSGHFMGRRKNFNQGKRRMISRTSMAQQEEIIRMTVYVSNSDQQWNNSFVFWENVTEEQLAALFISCGHWAGGRLPYIW